MTSQPASTTNSFGVPLVRHDWVAKRAGAPAPTQLRFARAGIVTEEMEFVAAKAGTFPFECSEYCGSGHRQMKGRLVVAARER